MLRLPPILLIQHIQRFPIEGEISIFDGIWEFPGLGVQVDFFVFVL